MKYVPAARSPQGRQHVYFTGYPDDVKRFFDLLTGQILARQNCVIFYEDDPEHPEDTDNFESDLRSMQLIVIPISTKFLTRDSFARRVVFPFAMERHIPVLPICTEPGLDALFARVCGDLQYLDLTAHDETAISYEEKLTRYLKSVLIGDETAKKVRDAFDAYIFLSYRKKDRRFAQELMRLIHRNDFCRDIAIWYDEYLVPGESFNQAIQDAIKKSELFALVVTPSLLEPDNYVMQHEYPDANGAGMKILPAELEATDRGGLEANYDAIPPCVDSRDDAALSDALAELLRDVAKPGNDSDPVHNFFIGLAYLGGIDVETDYDMALRLIEGAAEQELPEAMQKLADMYHNGEGVSRDYHKAIAWQRRLADVRRKRFEEDETEDTAIDWLQALSNLGDALDGAADFAKAIETFEELQKGADLCKHISSGVILRYTSIALYRLGDIFQQQGKLILARQYYDQSMHIDEQLSAVTGLSIARIDLSITYSRLGYMCHRLGELDEALKYYKKSLEISKKLAEETQTLEAVRNLSVIYSNLGEVLSDMNKQDEALQCFKLCIQIDEMAAAESPEPDIKRSLTISYNNCGSILRLQYKPLEALKYYKKALPIREQLAEQTGSVQARQDLAISYELIGIIYASQNKMKKARAYFEKSMQIREQLAAEIKTVQAYDDLATSHFNMRLVETDPKKQAEHLKITIAIYTSLAKQCPDVPKFAHRRDQAEDELDWIS